MTWTQLEKHTKFSIKVFLNYDSFFQCTVNWITGHCMTWKLLKSPSKHKKKSVFCPNIYHKIAAKICATWKYMLFSLKAFFGPENRPFCPSGCQWELGSSWGVKLTRRFICSLPQRCPEPWREPAGTPEEDRQCSSAAQGPSDAGAGGGVRSTLGALCATDLCGSHIPLLVGSGFWSVPASGALKKPKQRERTFPVPLLYPAQEWHMRVRRRNQTSCQSPKTMNSGEMHYRALQSKSKWGCCGEGGRLFDVFHLDFTLLLSAFFALHPCNPTSAPSCPSPSLPVIYRPPPHPDWEQNKL